MYNNKSCLLDGSVSNTWAFYQIGAFQLFQDKYIMAWDVMATERVVELYVAHGAFAKALIALC